MTAVSRAHKAKDRAMKETADAFTSSLPRTGSYDYAKDQADKEKKAKAKA